MAANMQRKRVRIGDLLVEQKIISEAQLQAALAEQKAGDEGAAADQNAEQGIDQRDRGNGQGGQKKERK